MFIEDALDTLHVLTKGDARAGELIASVRNQIDTDEGDTDVSDPFAICAST